MEYNNPITKELLLYIIEDLRSQYSESSEVIPTYTESEIDQLLNCIKRVYCGYYHSIEDRLCNLIYNITKGHYLSNGNKRVAVIITIIAYWFEIPEPKNIAGHMDEIKIIALNIAEGSLDKEALLRKFIEMIN